MNKNKVSECPSRRRPLGKSPRTESGERGFTLIELIVAMAISLLILGVAIISYSTALGTRSRESSTTDAITSAQAALNIMSREIGNSGYGLSNNGIVLGNDSNYNPPDINGQRPCGDNQSVRLHMRTNISNDNSETNDVGEDVTFYHDTDSESVVRYDANNGSTSGIINRVSKVCFAYHNYAADGTSTQGAAAANTGRVTIELTVILADVQGQPTNRSVTVRSDVTLRNSPFMLSRY